MDSRACGRCALGAPLLSWWSAESRGASRSLRTRRTLLLAAAREIDACGYHGASLSRILAAARLTKGALYFHFKSKEELARAVLVEAMESWREIVDTVHGLELDPLWTQLVEVDASVGRRMYCPLARAAGRIIVESGLCEELRSSWMAVWQAETTESMIRAAEADILREQVEPAHLARTVMALTAGHFILADAYPDDGDYFVRMNDMWEGVLPVVASEEWYAGLESSGWLSRPAPDPLSYVEARLP